MRESEVLDRRDRIHQPHAVTDRDHRHRDTLKQADLERIRVACGDDAENLAQDLLRALEVAGRE